MSAPTRQPEGAHAGREAALLAILALVPALPYVAALVAHPVPRFSMYGDFAILELVTRMVRNGHTLYGPYSRFGFAHPGPAYYYVMAPIYELLGRASSAIFAGALFVNVAAAATVVVALRLLASRAHALAATVTLLAWFAAFGNILLNPWNPLVIALPLVAYLVLASLFARGEAIAACPAAIFGAYVAQSHVAAVITVGGVGAGATLAFVLAKRRERWPRSDRIRVGAAVAVLGVMFLPVAIEQFSAQEGNLTKLLRFFLHRPEPLKPLSTALRNWALATSWSPQRVLEGSLLDDHGVALPMRWDVVPEFATPSVVAYALVHVGLLGVAAVVAWRRRDRVSVTLLAVAGASEALTIPALRSVVGESYYYLVFWATSASTVGWLGILSTAAGATAAAAWPRLAASKPVRPIAAALVALGCGGALATAGLQRGWLAHNVLLPFERSELRDLYPSLAARLREAGVGAVVHLSQGSWTVATVVLLELTKDGFPAYVDTPNRYAYGWPPPPPEGAPLWHVFVSDQVDRPLMPEHCFASLESKGALTVGVAPNDVSECR